MLAAWQEHATTFDKDENDKAQNSSAFSTKMAVYFL